MGLWIKSEQPPGYRRKYGSKLKKCAKHFGADGVVDQVIVDHIQENLKKECTYTMGEYALALLTTYILAPVTFIAGLILGAVAGIGAALLKVFRFITRAVLKLLGRIWDGICTAFEYIWDSICTVFEFIWDGICTVVGGIVGVFAAIFGGIFGLFGKILKGILILFGISIALELGMAILGFLFSILGWLLGVF